MRFELLSFTCKFAAAVSQYNCITFVNVVIFVIFEMISAWVAMFTLPKVYETNKTQIDANLDIVRNKLEEITSK